MAFATQDLTERGTKFCLLDDFRVGSSAVRDPAAKDFYALLERMRAAVRDGTEAWATYPDFVAYARICFWAIRKLEYSFAARAIAQLERRAERPLRVLDVGCGVVPFCNWLSRRGHDVVAIDPDWTTIQLLRAKNLNGFYNSSVRYEPGHAEDLQFDNESFDVVTFISVLEHVTPGNDRVAMYEMARVLKRGGALILSFDIASDPISRPGEEPWPEWLRRYAEPFTPL